MGPTDGAEGPNAAAYRAAAARALDALIKAPNGKERQAILPCAPNMPPPPADREAGGLTAAAAFIEGRRRCHRRAVETLTLESRAPTALRRGTRR